MLAAFLCVCTVACGNAENTVIDTDAQTDSVSPTDTSPIPDMGADPEEKSIDIYIIAGQSNAVGHSKVYDTAAIGAIAPGIYAGYTNILYSGNARTDTVTNNVRTIIDNDISWRNVTVGLGRQGGYIGPELGMAEALSSYYNKDTGRYAGIIKFAHGGTSLFDKSSGSNHFGNWVCPSYAKELGVSYNDGDVTGQLYRDLLMEISSNIMGLRSRGYTEINLKAIYWMQGENDRGEPDEYARVFAMFVKDLRKDLSDMMKQINGDFNNDGGASEMAVIVGTVSETFALSANDKTGALNVRFIKMQKNLTGSIENCYIVDNSKFVINRWDYENDQNVVIGADTYHWNQNDMVCIGKKVGEAILRNCLSDWNAYNNSFWESITQTDPNGNGWAENG